MKLGIIGSGKIVHDFLSIANQIPHLELTALSTTKRSHQIKYRGGGINPIIVYGHKHPYMLVAFMACAKAGAAYVPLDINMPENRIKDIIDSVEPSIILTTEKLAQYKEYLILDVTEESLYHTPAVSKESDWVKADDVFYIIFTSGSTGVPKGVQITYGALNYFTDWALSLGDCEKKNCRDRHIRDESDRI